MRPTLPDARVDLAQERCPKAQHGRVETRTLWALASPDLNAYLGSAGTVGTPWPGVAQVLRLQRVARWTDRATGRTRTRSEVAYAITSLPPERASAAALLLRWRAHWHIENRLHWVRDVTLGEDGCAIHVGQTALVLALLRTAVLALLRHAEAPSLAAVQRALALHPGGVLALFQGIAQALAARARSAPLRQLPARSTPPPSAARARAS